MKKNKTKILILAIVIISFVTSGCDWGSDKGLVGNWSLVSITKTNVNTDVATTQTIAELGYVQIFNLNEDESFSRTKDGVLTGKGTYTYNREDGYLKLTLDTEYKDDLSLGSGTSSVIDDVFDRGYFDSETQSNVAEIYSRIEL